VLEKIVPKCYTVGVCASILLLIFTASKNHGARYDPVNYKTQIEIKS
jgi:hypothetical protein